MEDKKKEPRPLYVASFEVRIHSSSVALSPSKTFENNVEWHMVKFNMDYQAKEDIREVDSMVLPIWLN